MRIKIGNGIACICIFIFMFPILFSSCSSDETEINEIAVVIGVGIDKVSGDEPIRVTLEIANPKSANVHSNMPIGNTSILLESTGKTFYDAIQNFSKTNSVLMDFTHAAIVIISKDLDENSFSEVIDNLSRNRQFRSTLWILVSSQPAKEILGSRIPNEDITSKGIDFMMSGLKRNPSILPITLNDFVIEAKSESKVSLAPVISLEGSSRKITVENMAVFKNNRLVGTLTNEESKSLLWLSDYSQGHIIVLPFKADVNDKSVTVDIYNKSNKIIPYITSHGVNFKIECTGYGKLEEVNNIHISSENIKKIESNTETIIKSQVNKLINKAQKDFNTDFVGFSKKLFNNHPSKWISMKKNWDDIFPYVKYEIDIKIKITNLGIIKDSVIGDDKEKK